MKRDLPVTEPQRHLEQVQVVHVACWIIGINYNQSLHLLSLK